MSSVSPLSPNAMRVLQTLLRQSGIRGGELVQRTGLTNPQELSLALQELRQNNLIEVGGDIAAKDLPMEDLPFVTIGIRPSQMDVAHLLVKRNL